ncbi:MAG TPA: hypothetical protein VGJ97_13680 [Anaerolineaceae bacterium]|jgi:hypothetical protein
MELFGSLFNRGPSIPKEHKAEFDNLMTELLKIGKSEDFLSEQPGGAYNGQCRHLRARAIGRRLDQIGGLALMQAARDQVRRKLGANLAAHLDYAWADVGEWIP